jgi:glutathione S-transferase
MTHMLTLHGSPISNYYNKAKLALLEKGLAFEEKVVDFRNKDASLYAASPLGKIPFLMTDRGCLCESQVILEYLEAVQPEPPLLPKDPFAAAKVRELATFLDWHLEMAARQLYGVAFFGAPPLSEGNLARIRREIDERIEGVKRLLKMEPFAIGDAFTMADCSAFTDLPLVGLATKAAYGEDLLLAHGVDYKPYLKFIGERPAAQKVQADRKAALAR